MKLTDFDYDLPPSFIAQEPLPKRENSKLMALFSSREEIKHHHFEDIVNLLKPTDILVLNDTKVIPARLVGRKASGGKVEILLLKRIEGNEWQALVHPSYKCKQGAEISVGQNGFQIQILDEHKAGEGLRTVLLKSVNRVSSETEISKWGRVPLPPYIKRESRAEDSERYQTVFARSEGAVAAPTAGLHFTSDLLDRLTKKGVGVVMVTLHVGYGTFKPVTSVSLREHKMHSEYFSIGKDAADKINSRRGRLVACGTTTLRALESAVDTRGRVRETEGETRLFIYPPYTFQTADVLITNFHLPRSTLLMLVSAFAGHSFVMQAYEEAKQSGYRFYSYGDAMLIEH